MEYWVVKRYQIGAEATARVSEYKFKTESAARKWAADKENEYIGTYTFKVEKVEE